MIPSLASSLLIVALFAFSDACMKVTPGTPGMPATPCKTCAQTLIMKTTNGAGSKAFTSDTTSTTGACAMRTLVCDGGDANIEVNAGDSGVIGDNGAGTISFTVTCNAAGTAWVNGATTVTQLECAATAP